MEDQVFPRMVTHQKALSITLDAAQNHRLGHETIKLAQAADRITTSAIKAPIDVPMMACSRMDGYAINVDEWRARGVLPLAPTIHAGDEAKSEDHSVWATPIMTGAVLPPGANAVVIKEQAQVSSDQVRFESEVQIGDHIRPAGTDLKAGQMLFRSSHQLKPSDLGLLASVGLDEVSVYQQPKVALIMSGDELVEPGEDLLPGQAYESNGVMLKALLDGLGCITTCLPALADDKAQVAECLSVLKASDHDLIITVGGVSAGDKDWLPRVMAETGQILMHKVRIKPGFPLLLAELGQAMYFGLPGNPVSAYTTLCQYVIPALKVMHGSDRTGHLRRKARLSADVHKSHLRREFMRGWYSQELSGEWVVEVVSGQASSRIKSLSDANCFVIVDESQTDLVTGDWVTIQPFSQFRTLLA